MFLSNFFFNNKEFIRIYFLTFLVGFFFLLFFTFPKEIKAACYCVNPDGSNCACDTAAPTPPAILYDATINTQGVAVKCDTQWEANAYDAVRNPVCGTAAETIPYCSRTSWSNTSLICWGTNFDGPITPAGISVDKGWQQFATPSDVTFNTGAWTGITDILACGSNVFCCGSPVSHCPESKTYGSCSVRNPEYDPKRPPAICSNSVTNPPPPGRRTPYPDPYVPCNETRPNLTHPFEGEFHSLRPYQASPCNRRLEDLALFCGNDFILTDSFSVDKQFDPSNYSGSYSSPPAVPSTPLGAACYACRGGNCSPIGFDPTCMGTALASYMNGVISSATSAGPLTHIKFLSPAFNFTNPVTYQIASAMNAAGADWSSLTGIAGNAYNCCGNNVTGHVSAFRTATGLNLPVMVTETGVIDGTLGDLGTQMSLVKGDSSYLGALFFNGFGYGNYDPATWNPNLLNQGKISDFATACGSLPCTKLGANSAVYYSAPSQFYSDVDGVDGMIYTLAISNGIDETPVLTDIGIAHSRNLIPIIRIGDASWTSGPSASQYGAFLRSIDSQVSGTVYAITGPNEPDIEHWLAPQCTSVSTTPSSQCIPSLNTCDPTLPNQCANSPDCRDNGDGTETCVFNISRTRDITIDPQDTELPIMGYTEPSIGNQSDPFRVINSRFQDETVTDPQKVNEYVSWYLNGVIGRAEYDPPDTDIFGNLTTQGEKRIIDFSGPLKRLLSWESQVVRRIQEVDKQQQGNIRHNQIVACSNILLGVSHCYPGLQLPPLIPPGARLSDFVTQAPPLQRIWNISLLSSIWNLYWNLVNPGQPPPPLPVNPSPFFVYWIRYQFWRLFNPASSTMFSYIPFSSTEDRVGQSRLDTYSIQPAGSSSVTILSSQITKQNPSFLYFSHMLESNELGELLQTLHSYKGADLAAPADPAIAPSAQYCDIREIRSNPGDSLFASNLTATIQYTAQMSCDFAIYDPTLQGNLCSKLTGGSGSCQPLPVSNWNCSNYYGQVDCGLNQFCGVGCTPAAPTCIPSGQVCEASGISLGQCCPGLACNTGTGNLTCGIDPNFGSNLNLTQNCSSTATIALQTVTETPLADEVWSRLVAGPAAVFKRIFPKIEDAPGRPIRRLWDIPAASPVNYTVTGGALAGNPATGRLGSQAELYFPHIGGIHEYFLNCIQKTLRPKGFGQGCTSAPDPLNDPYAPLGQIGGARCGISAQSWRIKDNPTQFTQHFRTLGVTNVRFGIDWAAVEGATKDVYDWNGNGIDTAVNTMLGNNTTIIGIFVTIPPWNTINPGDPNDPNSCIRNQTKCVMDRNDQNVVNEFRQFAQDVVRKYPRIRNWEFWNEPDMWENFKGINGNYDPNGNFDPALYVFWLNQFSDAAKQVDSSLTIAAAAPLGGAGASAVDDYYRYNGRFDAVTFHPYGANRNTDPLDRNNVLAIRDIMVTRGYSNNKIWLTEYGFNTIHATNSNYCIGGLSYAEQAQRVQDALSWIFTQNYVEFADLHMLHDIPPPEGPLCMGLTGEPLAGFSPLKDAYQVFQSLCTAPAAPTGGRCQIGTGLCSPTYLSQWFPGCHANQASVICNRESGGNPTALNDDCRIGATPDYSAGLFQINLLVHPPVCAAAFSYTSYPNPSCQILDQPTVDYCLYGDGQTFFGYFDPDENAAYASAMSGGGQDWSPWGSPNVICMQLVASLCP